MRKILLFGTMLGVASAALAFGGMFSHGSKSSTYKGGVDAIGVHFGGEKKEADSQEEIVSCPEGQTIYTTDVGNVCCPESAEPLCMYTDDSGKCAMYTCIYPWKSKPACAENETIYCIFPSCNGPGPRCCAENKTTICVQQADGVCLGSACCGTGEEAYCGEDRCYGAGAQCCAGEIFCSRRDAEGNCTTSNCCVNGTIFCLHEDENEICRFAACCPNGFTAVCTGYNDEGICNDWWCG